MKRWLFILGIFSLIVFNQTNQAFAHTGAVRTVVIDPGHGGREPGAVGRRNKEKDITLSLSQKVGELINQFLPDVKVIYTRTKDEFVGLSERARIANKNNADLFISIHCNGAGNRAAQGTETFVMGNDKSASNLAVAMKENASIYFEEDYEDIYDGFDPNKPETHILFSLFQHQYINQSLKMASLVQDQFRDRGRRIDRGVKQGPFWVLHQTAMPSVLIEVGFITNDEEEEFLASNEGQNVLASAIFRAFRDYKIAQDNSAIPIPEEPLVIQETPTPFPARNPEPEKKEETTIDNKIADPVNPIETTLEIENFQNSEPEQRETMVAYETQTRPTREPTIPNRPDVVFKVQFLSSDRVLNPNSPLFKGLKNVGNYHYMGMHRYTVGNESNIEAATNLQRTLRNQGFGDAFLVAFVNGKRVTINEALQQLGQ